MSDPFTRAVSQEEIEVLMDRYDALYHERLEGLALKGRLLDERRRAYARMGMMLTHEIRTRDKHSTDEEQLAVMRRLIEHVVSQEIERLEGDQDE